MQTQQTPRRAGAARQKNRIFRGYRRIESSSPNAGQRRAVIFTAPHRPVDLARGSTIPHHDPKQEPRNSAIIRRSDRRFSPHWPVWISATFLIGPGISQTEPPFPLHRAASIPTQSVTQFTLEPCSSYEAILSRDHVDIGLRPYVEVRRDDVYCAVWFLVGGFSFAFCVYTRTLVLVSRWWVPVNSLHI